MAWLRYQRHQSVLSATTSKQLTIRQAPQSEGRDRGLFQTKSAKPIQPGPTQLLYAAESVKPLTVSVQTEGTNRNGHDPDVVQSAHGLAHIKQSVMLKMGKELCVTCAASAKLRSHFWTLNMILAEHELRNHRCPNDLAAKSANGTHCCAHFQFGHIKRRVTDAIMRAY